MAVERSMPVGGEVGGLGAGSILPVLANPSRKKLWLVRLHHRMRTAAYLVLFAASVLHPPAWNRGPAVWALLGLLFLVYPHLQYWRAARAEDSLQAELANLYTDAVLLGGMMAFLGFPDWITFAAFLGSLANSAATLGWQGVRRSVAAFAAGAVVGSTATGFVLAPATEWPTALLCSAGLSVYLAMMGSIGFARIRQLRLTRQALRQREQELLSANETLQAKLREIDALQQKLREQASRDPLTGLYNRRYLDSTLERELARGKREGYSLALILIDIDHFKQVNDTYGHQAGDAILLRLAALLTRLARAGDVACRYGGEEFLLLMPTMPLEVARERAEDLREAFGQMLVPFGEFRLQATLSIGIAAYPGHGTSAEELIRHADAALYRAKHRGRNRVEAWAG